MALQAATVGILIEKSKFEPEVALGVSEAIELAMTHEQFVTVPILAAHLHEVRAEIRVLEEKLDACVKELKADTRRQIAELETKIEAKLGAMETKLAALEARLVRWVFLVMLGNVALSLAANTVVSAFRNG